MLKANNIPDVIFPYSVIRGYKQNMEREKEQESRKRQRSSEEGGRDSASASVASYTIPEGTEYAFMADGTLQLVKKGTLSPYYVPTPTPASSLRSTLATAPLPTPVSSPQRSQGAMPKKFKDQPKDQPKEQRVIQQQHKAQSETNPGLVLISCTDVILPENLNNQQLKKDAIKGKVMKYAFTNPAFRAEDVKKDLIAGKYDLTQVRRLNFAMENFHQINNGGLCKLDAVRRTERK